MLDIPRVAHRVYTNTFLGVVITRINYTATFDESQYDRFKSFFKDRYNFIITKDQFTLLQYHSLRFSGEDDNFKIKIGKGFIELFMSGDIYLSYKDSMKNHLDNFLNLLESLSQNVSEVSIEKINFFPIQLKTRDAYKVAINRIFNQYLVDEMPEKYSNEDLRLDIPIDQGKEMRTLLSFGWMTIEEDDLRICLILDCKTISGNLENWSPEQINNQVEEMNQFLFDLYHWSVSDDIIKKMN